MQKRFDAIEAKQKIQALHPTVRVISVEEIDGQRTCRFFCDLHGVQINSVKNLSDSRKSHACNQCSAINVEGYYYSETHRQCIDCNEILAKEGFEFTGRKDGQRYPRCYQCLRFWRSELAKKQKQCPKRKEQSNRAGRARRERIKNHPDYVPPAPKKSTISIVPCNHCGKLKAFKRTVKGYTCSTECRGARISQGGIVHAYVDKSCIDCGKAIKCHPLAKRCKRCRSIENKSKAGAHRKRARYYGVYYEYVNIKKVFDQDGWKCKECGVRVKQYNDMAKHTNRATLGHIIPLSKGGSHTYANVQCECWKCNTLKGNKINAAQLTIFCRVV